MQPVFFPRGGAGFGLPSAGVDNRAEQPPRPMIDRLKTAFWVQAQVRIANRLGLAATIARRGDATGGVVILKLNRGALGCAVLTQARTAKGTAAWLRALGGLVDEASADEYIARQLRYDADLWVLEIEDRDGVMPLIDPVL